MSGEIITIDVVGVKQKLSNKFWETHIENNDDLNKIAPSDAFDFKTDKQPLFLDFHQTYDDRTRKAHSFNLAQYGVSGAATSIYKTVVACYARVQNYTSYNKVTTSSIKDLLGNYGEKKSNEHQWINTQYRQEQKEEEIVKLYSAKSVSTQWPKWKLVVAGGGLVVLAVIGYAKTYGYFAFAVEEIRYLGGISYGKCNKIIKEIECNKAANTDGCTWNTIIDGKRKCERTDKQVLEEFNKWKGTNVNPKEEEFSRDEESRKDDKDFETKCFGDVEQGASKRISPECEKYIQKQITYCEQSFDHYSMVAYLTHSDEDINTSNNWETEKEWWKQVKIEFSAKVADKPTVETNVAQEASVKADVIKEEN